MQSDFQVARPAGGYTAVGSGDDLALGAMHALRKAPARTRAMAGLEAAAHHNAGVARPFRTLETRA